MIRNAHRPLIIVLIVFLLGVTVAMASAQSADQGSSQAFHVASMASLTNTPKYLEAQDASVTPGGGIPRAVEPPNSSDVNARPDNSVARYTLTPTETQVGIPTATPSPTATQDGNPTATPSPTAAVPPSVDYFLTGNPQNVTPATSAGLLLMGGSTDVDEAFEWQIEKSGGGDFVVIRASGSNGYNQYLYNLGTLDSVETLVIKSSAAANHPFVLEKVLNAEALFIAGGDQWKYVDYWRGSALEDTIHTLRDQDVPIGGTSAGLAIMGEFLFSAENGTVYSNEALADPYNQYMTLEQDFLDLPYLGNVITDTHFRTRDRMGRLIGFLARILQDGWATEARGIGVNEKTALRVELDGSATVVGNSAVYFLRTPGMPEVCQPLTPLTFQNISVYRIYPGGAFDLSTWTGSGGLNYEVSAMNGNLSSNLPRGGIY